MPPSSIGHLYIYLIMTTAFLEGVIWQLTVSAPSARQFVFYLTRTSLARNVLVNLRKNQLKYTVSIENDVIWRCDLAFVTRRMDRNSRSWCAWRKTRTTRTSTFVCIIFESCGDLRRQLIFEV